MKRLLLLLLLAVSAQAQPTLRNFYTTNANPYGTLNTLQKMTATNRLGDSRVLDDGTVLTAGGNGADLSGITNSTDVVGIGENALTSAVITNAAHIVAIGDNAGGSMAATAAREIYGFGNGALARAMFLDVATSDIYSFGRGSMDSATITNSQDVVAIGNALSAATLADSSSIWAMGLSALDSAVIVNSSSSVFALGDNAGASLTADGSVQMWAVGQNALGGAVTTNAIDLYTFGTDALSGATVTDSSDILAVGKTALGSATLASSSTIYAFGSDALLAANLTNSSDVIALGNGAGIALNGTFAHVFLAGSGAQATASNQWVAGDAAYIYQFPGVQATFGGFVALSGTTNQYTDNGSTLLRNGVAISGSAETTATNVQVLAVVTTNVSQLDFSTVARGGVFKLQLSGNAFIGTPANVTTNDFKKAFLIVRQPSTGTCLLQWTNASFAWPEGVAPVIDTNNSSTAVFELVTDVFSNIVHGTMVPLSRLP